jgi:hypothetical protein
LSQLILAFIIRPVQKTATPLNTEETSGELLKQPFLCPLATLLLNH